jgi:cell wall-associated NlpC family hydrolase
MKKYEKGVRWRSGAILFCAGMLMGGFDAFALVDNAQLISVSVGAGTQVMPRTIFTQTWTMQNTGTTTWSPGEKGYTLNLVGPDSLGAVPFSATNTVSTWSVPSATIGSAKPVAPGAQAIFSMSFIAPETSGSTTDTFQICNASGVFFGPRVSVEVVLAKAGSTNQYDRAKVVSYANNYARYVCSDGCYWTNGSSYGDFGALAPVPTSELGDDCAHFVSCCIGRQPAQWGGGLSIPSRVPPTYGEPGAGRLVNTVLIAPGFAAEVFSLSSLRPGDLIGWNWEGDTNIEDLDHVCLYLGNGVVAAHSASCLDVPATTWYQNSEPEWRWHLIHIFDAPTMTTFRSGSKLVLSWGTNWSGYVLYSATSLSAQATWTKVSTTPVVIGALNMVTNTMPQNALFYRLALP